MTDNTEYVEMEDNQQTRDYFDQFCLIVQILKKISKQKAENKYSAAEDKVVFEYIEKLENTMRALQAKYYFNGVMNHRQSSMLYIDTIDSGFPMEKEIEEMMADKARANDFLENLPSKQEIRESILDFAMSKKSVNQELQYDLAMRRYYQMLVQNDLFRAVMKPQFFKVKGANNSNPTYLCHWAVFDVKKNIPNIYIMIFEYSGGGELTDDKVFYDSFCAQIIGESSSALKLLSIAHHFDSQFASVHPKSLKRVHVGPVYKNGVTKHNGFIESVLANVSNPNNNWVFAWSVESLLSKSSRQIKKSLFGGGQQQEVFYVDTQHHEAFEAGASDIERSMIIPYEAYQSLVDSENNPLNKFNKYVVDPRGEVVYL